MNAKWEFKINLEYLILNQNIPAMIEDYALLNVDVVLENEGDVGHEFLSLHNVVDDAMIHFHHFH